MQPGLILYIMSTSGNLHSMKRSFLHPAVRCRAAASLSEMFSSLAYIHKQQNLELVTHTQKSRKLTITFYKLANWSVAYTKSCIWMIIPGLVSLNCGCWKNRDCTCFLSVLSSDAQNSAQHSVHTQYIFVEWMNGLSWTHELHKTGTIIFTWAVNSDIKREVFCLP